MTRARDTEWQRTGPDPLLAANMILASRRLSDLADGDRYARALAEFVVAVDAALPRGRQPGDDLRRSPHHPTIGEERAELRRRLGLP